MIEAYFDGACEPINPGGTASYGAIIFIDDQRIWECSKIYHPIKKGQTSNNLAEYSGLIAILDYLMEEAHFLSEIKIYGDSKIVIEQMKGTWKIKKGLYVPLALMAKKKLRFFKKLTLQWIPREQNSLADELSKAELIKMNVRIIER